MHSHPSRTELSKESLSLFSLKLAGPLRWLTTRVPKKNPFQFFVLSKTYISLCWYYGRQRSIGAVVWGARASLHEVNLKIVNQSESGRMGDWEIIFVFWRRSRASADIFYGPMLRLETCEMRPPVTFCGREPWPWSCADLLPFFCAHPGVSPERRRNWPPASKSPIGGWRNTRKINRKG